MVKIHVYSKTKVNLFGPWSIQNQKFDILDSETIVVIVGSEQH